MNVVHDPLIYDFETVQAEAKYTDWLRTKVTASLDDSRPPVPHDEIERRMAERLQALNCPAPSN